MEIKDLKDKFFKLFGHDAQGVFFAPGRANLIGEHTDYNGGHVFPCALSFGTYLLARKRDDGQINFYSLNFEKDGIIETDLNSIKKTSSWTDYPKGVVEMMRGEGVKIDKGFDALYYGNIPNGAGLSSSASIEVVTAVMLNKFFDGGKDMIKLALVSQKAENKFVGLNCGILDQFAVAMGKKDNAMLLDCNTLKYQYVPVQLDGISIVIANTNKRRDLAASKYNERRAECETALNLLQQRLKINNLCDITLPVLEANKDLLAQSDVIYRRARHAIAENDRTLQAVPLLISGDIAAFGQLMNASHQSLKDAYEVTGAELDALAFAFQKQPGVLGARMMGGGFGGCTVALVKDDFIADVEKAVAKEYTEKTGLKADFYIASIGDGARQI